MKEGPCRLKRRFLIKNLGKIVGQAFWRNIFLIKKAHIAKSTNEDPIDSRSAFC